MNARWNWLLLAVLFLAMVSGASAALTDGLVSYYNASESNGTSLKDMIGSYDLSEVLNTVGGVDGIIDGGRGNLTIGGFYTGCVEAEECSSDNYFSGSSQLAYGSNQSFTLNGWVNVYEASGWYTGLFGVIQGVSGSQLAVLYTLPSGVPYFYFQVGDAGEYSATGIDPLPTNQWVMLTGVWDAATRNTSVYINGTLVGTNHMPDEDTNTSAEATTFWIGNPGQNAASMAVDELGVWSRALSASEVIDLYSSGGGLAYPFGVSPFVLDANVVLVSPPHHGHVNATNVSFVGVLTQNNGADMSWSCDLWFGSPGWHVIGSANVTANATVNVSADMTPVSTSWRYECNNSFYDVSVVSPTFALTVDACVENWTCSSFAACAPNNVSACLNVTDMNVCGNTFNGSLSSYDEACVYGAPCSPSWSCSHYGACVAGNTKPCLNVSDAHNCNVAFNGSLSSYAGGCTYGGGSGGGGTLQQTVQQVAVTAQTAIGTSEAANTSTFSKFITSIWDWIVGLFA